MQAFQNHEAPTATHDVAGALDQCIVATYSHSPFNTPIRAEWRADTVVADPIEFDVRLRGINRKFEIVRQPAMPDPNQPAGSLVGGKLLTSRPGLYVVRLTISGGFSRDIEVVVWPTEAVKAVGFADHQAFERRMRLRAITRHATVTRETITAALETGTYMTTHKSFGKVFDSNCFVTFVGQPEGTSVNLNAFYG